jgi:hypothetical protein
MSWTVRDLAKMIDHSLLVPSLVAEDLEKGCRSRWSTTSRASASFPTT